jgi:hypothetical protein
VAEACSSRCENNRDAVVYGRLNVIDIRYFDFAKTLAGTNNACRVLDASGLGLPRGVAPNQSANSNCHSCRPPIRLSHTPIWAINKDTRYATGLPTNAMFGALPVALCWLRDAAPAAAAIQIAVAKILAVVDRKNLPGATIPRRLLKGSGEDGPSAPIS